MTRPIAALTLAALLSGAVAGTSLNDALADDTNSPATEASLMPVSAAASAAAATAADPSQATGFVHTAGRHFVGPDGTPFAIRGINLGNWLVPEGYMFKFRRMHAPKEINVLIERLIGPAEAKEFWDIFRENYVTEDDIRYLKAAGFNTVRVPLHYALFVDPSRAPGDPGYYDGPGYRLLDRVIGWCRTAGLKVIVDL
ncbi:MAG TPA: cellulase family glycosylhydrolase, partial [Terriglobales bacterium]|nr:cellulase family glycosylhydrolase [Terriglobales bacterium]